MKRRTTFVRINSEALGDNIAAVPIISQYQRETGNKVICETQVPELFDYKNLTFIKDWSLRKPKTHDIYIPINYAIVGVDDRYVSWPMQKAVAHALNVEYKETRAKFRNVGKDHRSNGKPYVCIAVHSSSQCKYWNHPTGWEEVVDYLQSLGYDVLAIDKYAEVLGNTIPSNAIDWTGAMPLLNRVKTLNGASMFIGTGSGLSWMAWSTGIPTVLISGFSAPYTEPTDNVWRITAPKGKCHHCYNIRGVWPEAKQVGWEFCPDMKGKKEQFECSKYIEPEQVIEAIKEIHESTTH